MSYPDIFGNGGTTASGDNWSNPLTNNGYVDPNVNDPNQTFDWSSYADPNQGGGGGFDLNSWLNDMSGMTGGGNTGAMTGGTDPNQAFSSGGSTSGGDPNLPLPSFTGGGNGTAGSGAVQSSTLQNLLQQLLGGGSGGGNNSTSPSAGGNLLTTLANMYTQHQKQNQLNTLMGAQIDPNLNHNRDLLSQSYSDPNSWLTGPEGTALSNVISNKYDRLAASHGLNANPIGRAKELQDAMMAGLGSYRTGLNQSIQAGTNALGGAQNTINGYQGASPANNLTAGLTNQTNGGSSTGLNDIVNLSKQIYGAFNGSGG